MQRVYRAANIEYRAANPTAADEAGRHFEEDISSPTRSSIYQVYQQEKRLAAGDPGSFQDAVWPDGHTLEGVVQAAAPTADSQSGSVAGSVSWAYQSEARFLSQKNFMPQPTEGERNKKSCTIRFRADGTTHYYYKEEMPYGYLLNNTLRPIATIIWEAEWTTNPTNPLAAHNIHITRTVRFRGQIALLGQSLDEILFNRLIAAVESFNTRTGLLKDGPAIYTRFDLKPATWQNKKQWFKQNWPKLLLIAALVAGCTVGWGFLAAPLFILGIKLYSLLAVGVIAGVSFSIMSWGISQWRQAAPKEEEIRAAAGWGRRPGLKKLDDAAAASFNRVGRGERRLSRHGAGGVGGSHLIEGLSQGRAGSLSGNEAENETDTTTPLLAVDPLDKGHSKPPPALR